MVSQPYVYQRHELVEPDWRRFPGWAGVSAAEWESAQWQRAHCVKNARQLKAVTGTGLDERFFSDLDQDQRERATMSMLLPPQMLNTMVPSLAPDERGFTEAFYADPVRRYMIPAFSDRRTEWPSHPYAQRDSLHEAEMWAVEGLTHRYPTKVLAEVGAEPEHLVNLTVYTTDAARYRADLGELGVVYRRHLGKHYPAMAFFEVRGLFDPAALVELVGTAVVPD